jgi:hypothetical protein
VTVVPSSRQEALNEAKRAAIQRDVRFSRHARERMQERAAGVVDVYEAMWTATSAIQQPPRDKWKLTGGRDRDGDGLDVVVDWTHGEARVVTVMAPT